MKTPVHFVLGVALLLPSVLAAESGAPGEIVVPEAAPAPERVVVRQDHELDTLLGPIALYPDPLISLILPAATNVADVVLAARHLEADGDVTRLDDKTWDASVKGLVHYPSVLRWLDSNLEWVNQLGDAFAAQPEDVMRAVQRLRARARIAGTLRSTSQQTVIVEEDVISIVPANPGVIYVPSYDPEVVYVERQVRRETTVILFDAGWVVGPWLSYDCDWRHRRIWWVHRPHGWYSRPVWHRPVFPGHPHYVDRGWYRPWTPRREFRHDRWRDSGRGREVVRPRHYSDGDVRRDRSRGAGVGRPPNRGEVPSRDGGYTSVPDGTPVVSPPPPSSPAVVPAQRPNRGPWRPSGTRATAAETVVQPAPAAVATPEGPAPASVRPVSPRAIPGPRGGTERVRNAPAVAAPVGETPTARPAVGQPVRERSFPRNTGRPGGVNTPVPTRASPRPVPAQSVQAPAPAAAERAPVAVERAPEVRQSPAPAASESDRATTPNRGPWRRGREDR